MERSLNRSEAAEVPTKTEVCLWTPSEFSHYCGDWTAWEAQLPDDGKCPDCGRKIEVAGWQPFETAPKETV